MRPNIFAFFSQNFSLGGNPNVQQLRSQDMFMFMFIIFRTPGGVYRKFPIVVMIFIWLHISH